MVIRMENDHRNLLVYVEGDIDHHSSEGIRHSVDKEYERINGKNIIFDFSQVTFMDSSGIGMVIGRYKLVGALGGQVYVTGISPALDRLFVISGLQKIIRCVPTVGDALDCIVRGA